MKMNEKQKKELSDKLKHILAGRQISELAEESGVSRSYLSRYISQSRDTAPTPEILRKIAKASNEEETYEDLMIKVGYWDEDSLQKIAEKRRWFIGKNKPMKENENYVNFLKERFKHTEMIPVYKFEEDLIWERPNYNKKKFNYTSEENLYFSIDLAKKAKFTVKITNHKMKEIEFIKKDDIFIEK